LANAWHLYYWQEKNLGGSEGGLSFVNSLNSFCSMMHQLTIDNLKGHVIDNDVHVFHRKCPSRHRGMFEFITNIKIIGLKDLILLLFHLRDGDISRWTSSHPSSHLRSLLTYMQTFYLLVKSFTKKWRWVKYWQMTFNLPNLLPKFSLPHFCTIWHYVVNFPDNAIDYVALICTLSIIT